MNTEVVKTLNINVTPALQSIQKLEGKLAEFNKQFDAIAGKLKTQPLALKAAQQDLNLQRQIQQTMQKQLQQMQQLLEIKATAQGLDKQDLVVLRQMAGVEDRIKNNSRNGRSAQENHSRILSIQEQLVKQKQQEYTLQKALNQSYSEGSINYTKSTGKSFHASAIPSKMANSLVYSASSLMYSSMRQVLAESLETVKSYEKGIVDLRRTLQGVTEKELADLGQNAIHLAKEFGIELKSIQDAMTELARAGVDDVSSLDTLTQTVAIGLNTTEIKTSADMVGYLISTIKQLDMDMSDSMNIIDSWNYLADQYAVHTDDFAKAIQRAGAASNTFGLDLYDVNAMVTILGEATQASGEAIGTAIKSLEVRLLRPETVRTLESYGIAVKKNEKEFLSFKEIMNNVNDVISGLDENSIALSKVMDAMGGAWRKNWIQVLTNDWERFDKLVEEQKGNFGYSIAENAKAMETWEKKIEQLKQAWLEMFIDTFQDTGITDFLKDATDGLTTVIELINESGLSEMLVHLLEGLLAFRAIKFVDNKMGILYFLQTLTSRLTVLQKTVNGKQNIGDSLRKTLAISGINHEQQVAVLKGFDEKHGTNTVDNAVFAKAQADMRTQLVANERQIEKNAKALAAYRKSDHQSSQQVAMSKHQLRQENKMLAASNETLRKQILNEGQMTRRNAAITQQNIAVKRALTVANLKVAATSLAVNVAMSAAMMGVFALINLGLKGLDKLIVTTEEQREIVENLKQDFQDLQTELEGLNDTYKQNIQRITELQKLKKLNGLTFEEKSELEKLQAENRELEYKIQLLERLSIQNQKQLERETVKLYKKDFLKDGEKLAGPANHANEEVYVQYVMGQHQSTKDKIALLESKGVENLSKKEQRELARLQKDLEKYDEYLTDASRRMLEMLSDLGDATTEEGKRLKETLQESIDEILYLFDPEKFKADKFTELLDSNQFADTAQALLDLAQNGKLTADTLKDPAYAEFVNQLEKSKITIPEIVEQFNAMTNGGSEVDGVLRELADSTHKLETTTKTTQASFDDYVLICQAVKDHLILTDEQAAHLVSTNADLVNSLTRTTDGWYLEESALSVVSASMGDLQNAYINAQISITNFMASETAKRLQNMGIELDGIKTTVDAYNQISHLAADMSPKDQIDYGVFNIPQANSSFILPGTQAFKDLGTLFDYANEKQIIETGKAELNKLQSQLNSASRGTSGSARTGSSQKDIEKYTSTIQQLYREMLLLDTIQEKVARNEEEYDHAKTYAEKNKLLQEKVELLKEEQAALHKLNEARRSLLDDNLTVLRNRGFDITYDSDTNDLTINNMEHINQLKGKDREATNALIKSTEDLLNQTTDLNDACKESSKSWRENKYAIDEAAQSMEDLRKEEKETAQELIEEFQKSVLSITERQIKQLEHDRDNDPRLLRIKQERKQLEAIQDEIEALEYRKKNDSTLKRLEDEIEKRQEALDLEKKKADQTERQNQLLKQQQLIENLKKEKNRLVYHQDSGWVREADTAQIAEEEDALQEMRQEAAWEAEQDAIDALQDKYDDLSDHYDSQIRDLKDYVDNRTYLLDLEEKRVKSNYDNQLEALQLFLTEQQYQMDMSQELTNITLEELTAAFEAAGIDIGNYMAGIISWIEQYNLAVANMGLPGGGYVSTTIPSRSGSKNSSSGGDSNQTKYLKNIVNDVADQHGNKLSGGGNNAGLKDWAKNELKKQGYAAGTLSAAGGLSLVGENGPELRVLNQGDGVIPTNLTRNLMQWARFNPASFFTPLPASYDSQGNVNNDESITIQNLYITTPADSMTKIYKEIKLLKKTGRL